MPRSGEFSTNRRRRRRHLFLRKCISPFKTTDDVGSKTDSVAVGESVSPFDALTVEKRPIPTSEILNEVIVALADDPRVVPRHALIRQMHLRRDGASKRR